MSKDQDFQVTIHHHLVDLSRDFWDLETDSDRVSWFLEAQLLLALGNVGLPGDLERSEGVIADHLGNCCEDGFGLDWAKINLELSVLGSDGDWT